MRKKEIEITLTEKEVSHLETLLEGGIKITDSMSQVEIFKGILSKLNTQPQAEENEPEKVYVEPYESANPEGAIKVEWKSRDEIADNLQAQFEYGRHGTYKDLESARKVFDKERVKEWDRTAMETYKQATQDTPEEWEEDFRGFLDFVIEDDSNKKEVVEYVKNLLLEREREAEENLLKRLYSAKSKKEFRDMLSKLNNK